MLKQLCIVIFSLLVMSCSDDSLSVNSPNDNVNSDVNNDLNTSANLPIPDNRFKDQYKVLIFGNSHVTNIGPLIEKMINAESNNLSVDTLTVGGGFLDSASSRNQRTSLLEGQTWTHLILQGQKYSQAGITEYPTRAAKSWISQAKEKNITPILFPEHPQRGNREEATRVHKIHTGIAKEQKSCVAPVGLAWDRVISIQPGINLYLSDGNHASATGKALTAFVLYEVITGNPADLLPFVDNINVDAATQQLFKQVATETIQSHVACVF